MTVPRVSIVVPSFQQARYLDEALVSVLEQDYPDLEVLVVDGGSTDGSVEIVRRHEGRLAWWVSEPDGGQVAALNKGFARATGEFLGWLNSDDVLAPGAVRTAVQLFEGDPDLLLVYGDNDLLDAGSQRTGLLPARPFDILEMLRTFQNHVPQPGSLFRRRALELSPLDERGYYYFDFEFVVGVGLRGPVSRVPEVLGGYRLHEDAKSLSLPRKKADDILRTVDVVFAREDLPPAVRAVEPESRAIAARTAAEYMYAAGDHAGARACLRIALVRSPRTFGLFGALLLLRTLAPPAVSARLRALRRRRGLRAPSAPS